MDFRDITFAYPNRPGRLVLKGFNLEIPPGERPLAHLSLSVPVRCEVWWPGRCSRRAIPPWDPPKQPPPRAGTTCALVGESGGGKSTVIALLERFYEPLAGAVLIDGIDVRSLNTRWMRSCLGLVPQEPVTFRASVEDNIRIGRAGASAAEVAAAARAANALDFIERLPEGLATLVGEGGIQLSGGQKQVCERGRGAPGPQRPPVAPAHVAERASPCRGSPSPAQSSGTRASCCWTRPRARWTPRASAWCRTRWTL